MRVRVEGEGLEKALDGRFEASHLEERVPDVCVQRRYLLVGNVTGKKERLS